MSLENNIKRIADALEKIADSMSPVAAAPVAAAPVAAAPVAAAPVAAAPVAAAPVAAAAEQLLTAEEMNTALVAEFKRLGNREPIDQAMATCGVASVQDLTAEQQQLLLTTVRALQP